MAMKKKELPECGVEIFENEIFGQIRYIRPDPDFDPWFVAADVCKVLDIQNSRDVVAKQLDDDEKGVATIYTLGGAQKMNVVSEPGLYRLIFMSRKPEAEKFKRWVFHEVLPSIRKTGSYSVAAEKKMVIYFKKPAPELLEPMTEEEFFDVIGKLAEAERIEIRQG